MQDEEERVIAAMMQTAVQRTNRAPRRGSQNALTIPVQRKTDPVERKQTSQPAAAVSLSYRPDHYGTGNKTGIPTSMLLRAESLSGVFMGDVRVHYNSGMPATLGALAAAQSPHIYLGPGQEGHLGHEIGHIIQQKRGLVRPQFRTGGKQINASPFLERDADLWKSRLGGIFPPVQLQMPPGRVMAGAALSAEQPVEVVQCFFPPIGGWLKRRVTWERIKKSSLWSLIDATQVCLANLFAGGTGTTIASCVGIVAQIMNALGLWTRSSETGRDARGKCSYIIKILAGILGILAAVGGDISGIVAGWTSGETKKGANFASRGFAVGSDTIGILMAVAYISGDGVNLRAWGDTLAMLYNLSVNSAAMGAIGAENKDVEKNANWVLIGELVIRLLRMLLTWFGVGGFRPPDLREDDSGTGSSTDPGRNVSRPEGETEV